MVNIKSLGTLLIRTLLTVPLSVIRIILIALLLIPIILSKLINWFCKFLKRHNFKEIKDIKPCHLPFPEDVMRRPDPCIYSQFYLQEQNLPVTWNNPDIWMSRASSPNVIEPDSYHLDANTNYIASVRVHNSSVDAATGVKVRFVYRPWSFNSPDLVPVMTDANGNEVVRTINVAGMDSGIVQFNWRTPPVPPGEEKKHWCLQAHLYHPMDTNVKNNLGQENSLVYNQPQARLATNDIVELNVPLFNHDKEIAHFTIAAIQYNPDEKSTVELKLKSNVGRRKRNSTQKLISAVPVVNFGVRRGNKINFAGLEWTKDLVTVRNKYVGFEKIKSEMQKGKYSLPRHLTLKLEDNHNAIKLEPGTHKTIKIQIVNSLDHETATTYHITLIAISNRNIAVGGVTTIFTY